MRSAILAATLSCLVGAASANAAISFSGSVGDSTEMTGADFSATLDYSFVMGNLGVLNLSLTNTTPDNIGGFLTAFVFTFATADNSASASLDSSSNANFSDLPNAIASPFGGPYIGGASTGGNFEGGGPPSQGIAVGDTATFVFDIMAADAASLTDLSFLGGNLEFPFIARFRGLNDGGSDKVPAIPAPSAAAMLIAGAGLLHRRRH